jgi:HJR/Mrr/RecB family endonuclease
MYKSNLLKSYSPEIFVGRIEELKKLETLLIREKEKVVTISGNNAVGKTSLWKEFLKAQKKTYAEKVEVLSASSQFRSFPKIDKNISLVIVDDISFDFNFNTEKNIIDLINKNSDKQFLLVGAYVTKFKKLFVNNINLDYFQDENSDKLLNQLLKTKISPKEIQKIANFTKGNPYLLTLFSSLLNQNKYTIDEIYKLITEKISRKGIYENSGAEIIDTSPKFQHIVSDIRIVNSDILKFLKRRPEDMYNLTSRQFEEMVAELMIKRGYNVEITKETRDGGKDLIIANQTDIGNFMYYLECKKYSPNNPVGVNLVRELAGTVSVDRVTAGILVTSSYFSPDAIQFSEKIKHQMSLVDYIKLKEWLTLI